MADRENWEGQEVKEQVAHKADDTSSERIVSSDDEPVCAEEQWFPPRVTVHTQEPVSLGLILNSADCELCDL